MFYKISLEILMSGHYRYLIHGHTRPGWLIVFHDITERKRVEQALSESEGAFSLGCSNSNGWYYYCGKERHDR